MNHYLPRQESEWVKTQGEGYLLKLVRGAMALHESPRAPDLPPDVPFTEVRPRLLSGAELLHPKR